MKITRITAFEIGKGNVGAVYRDGATPTRPRRDPWTKTAQVATPMSGYERFRRSRSSWTYDGPVGCLVTADDGSWGFGTTRFGKPVVGLINQHLGPLLENENPMSIDRLWDMMIRMASPYSASGLASYAISAIDLALWDLKGKVLNLPVYELAGGSADDPLFCYATGNDTDWHMELGFKATKLACPFGPFDGVQALSQNEELVASTRELIGAETELMLDCWMAFDVEFAVRMAERLRPYGLRWLEDCLMPEDLEAHKSLRSRAPHIGLATGEHWHLPQTFSFAANHRVADVFQPDICWAAGFSGCQRIARIAEAVGIEPILHAGMNTPFGQHFSFAMPNIRWGELFVGGGPGVPLKETVGFPGQVVPVDGYLTPNGDIGFGLGLTLDDLEAMRA